MFYFSNGSVVAPGSIYAGDCQPGDRVATDAEVAAWSSANAPAATFGFLQFLALFTSSEQQAIVSSADVNVKLFLLIVTGATYISMADQRTIDGIAYLVSVGLLTSARSAAILAAPSPN